MSRMLGAPFGGTKRGGHHCLESKALSLMTPPNFIGGAGSCFPSIVIVALGAPGVPLICCAGPGRAMNIAAQAVSTIEPWLKSLNFIVLVLLTDVRVSFAGEVAGHRRPRA